MQGAGGTRTLSNGGTGRPAATLNAALERLDINKSQRSTVRSFAPNKRYNNVHTRKVQDLLLSTTSTAVVLLLWGLIKAQTQRHDLLNHRVVGPCVGREFKVAGVIVGIQREPPPNITASRNASKHQKTDRQKET